MENFSEITSIQPAGGGDILYGDIVLEILLDEGEGLLYVEVPQTASLSGLGRGRGGGADQAVQEQIEMPDQVERWRLRNRCLCYYINGIYTA